MDNSIKNNKVAIYGAGGFGREMLLLLNQINEIKNTWEIECFFDDGIKKGTIINGLKVFGGIKELNDFHEPLNLVIAIADPNTKLKIFSLIKKIDIEYPVIIHPSVKFSSLNLSAIGKGSIITEGCILTCNFEIGEFVFINLNTFIGHDVKIGNYSSIMPKVSICGDVEIGKSVYIGAGAILKNKIQIASESYVGIGSVVLNNLDSGLKVFGNPARIIK